MDRKDASVHYHIRWTQIPLLDWESFKTRVEAEAGAKILARQGETYKIEEHGEGCQRCRDATKAKSTPGTAQAYREPE
jgi:coenzyme F420-reducing hydrogenase beta subunit